MNILGNVGGEVLKLDDFENGKLSSEKKPDCLGYVSGMKYYPVIWGLFHKPL